MDQHLKKLATRANGTLGNNSKQRRPLKPIKNSESENLGRESLSNFINISPNITFLWVLCMPYPENMWIFVTPIATILSTLLFRKNEHITETDVYQKIRDGISHSIFNFQKMTDGTGIIELFFAITFRLIAWIFFLRLDKVVPVIRHIDEDEMWYYRYPSVDSYVPKQYLYLFITVVPCTVLLFQFIINRNQKSTIPNIITTFNGLTLAYCINGVITSVLKLSTGRPRPNFFLRCFPDGYGTDIDKCTGEYRGMMDGRKSFPSAHSSFAFTSMVYLTLHLRKLIDFKKPRFLRGFYIFFMFSPLLFAALIAVSRTADYHHHYSDVIGGAMLGSAIAYIVHSLYCEVDTETEDKLLDMVQRYSYISLNLG